jgi:uncharacterized membrane protein YsdA (DUF1294 family)
MLIPLIYLIASIITFLVYAHDKYAAKHNRWRTKESTLHSLALLGGWPGALLAQKVLHHKSSKVAFQRVFWVTVVVNVAVIGWLVSTGIIKV